MGDKYRQVVYTEFFQAFFSNKILDIIEQLELIPESYLKYIVETDGLYEIRVQLGRRIFRVFFL